MPKPLDRLVGSSPTIAEVKDLILKAAGVSAPVIISGETGTGKELVAHALQHLSPRRHRKFVKVNCPALPETLAEAELLGHKRGAFTHAFEDREGRVAAAHEGTLFLDEIAELPLSAQAKLLRVVESGEFEKVGSSQPEFADVRVLAATNIDLEAAVKQGKFRADLFFRLNVFRIQLAPLRERAEDIPELANYFLSHFCAKYGKPCPRLTDEAVQVLTRYPWPGNVRELKNVTERAVAPAKGRCLRAEDFPISATHVPLEPDFRIPVGVSMQTIKGLAVEAALRFARGNRTQAARRLGISRRTLRRILRDEQSTSGSPRFTGTTQAPEQGRPQPTTLKPPPE